MKLDFTNELADLLDFTGETATAIRMYSCYAKSYKELNDQDSLDIMFLSDFLHHFSCVSSAVKGYLNTENKTELAFTCKRLISFYEDCISPEVQETFCRSATLTLEKNKHFVDLNIPISALKSILNKLDLS